MPAMGLEVPWQGKQYCSKVGGALLEAERVAEGVARGDAAGGFDTVVGAARRKPTVIVRAAAQRASAGMWNRFRVMSGWTLFYVYGRPKSSGCGCFRV